jgi:hypothetical protein
LGPAPFELFQGFDLGQARHADPALNGAVLALFGFRVDQLGQIPHMGPLFPGGPGRQGFIIFTDETKFQDFQIFDQALLVAVHAEPFL